MMRLRAGSMQRESAPPKSSVSVDQREHRERLKINSVPFPSRFSIARTHFCLSAFVWLSQRARIQAVETRANDRESKIRSERLMGPTSRTSQRKLSSPAHRFRKCIPHLCAASDKHPLSEATRAAPGRKLRAAFTFRVQRSCASAVAVNSVHISREGTF